MKHNSVDMIHSTTMKPGEVQRVGKDGGDVGLGFVAMPCLALSLAELAEEGRQLHSGTSIGLPGRHWECHADHGVGRQHQQ